MFGEFVIGYLFLAGTGAGAAVCSTVIDTQSNPSWDSRAVPLAARIGFAGCALCLACATLMLFLDLGRPEKVLYLFVNPFRSLVSVGAWLLLLSTACSVALCTIIALECDRPYLMRILEIAILLLAIGVMAYTGVLLSSMVSVDFWNTPWLVAVFIVSALNCGSALIMFVSSVFENGTRKTPWLTRATHLLLGLEIIALVGFGLSRWFYSGSARASCEMLLSGGLSDVFWLGLVAIGLVLPLVLAILQRFVDISSLEIIDAGAVLTGGVCLRCCIVLPAMYSAIQIIMS